MIYYYPGIAVQPGDSSTIKNSVRGALTIEINHSSESFINIYSLGSFGGDTEKPENLFSRILNTKDISLYRGGCNIIKASHVLRNVSHLFPVCIFILIHRILIYLYPVSYR